MIPVKDVEKREKMDLAVHINEETFMVEEVDLQTPKQRRNLTMIYLLFLAEAIMASSLSSQIAVLVPSASGCVTMNTSFLRSILECAYFFGAATGMFWGVAADRFGRRKIALVGLSGMSTCCVCMGFANTLPSMAGLRFVAGTISSAVSISGLAMLADVTHGSKSRMKVVARLPMVAVCGSLGPLASNMVRALSESHLPGLFVKYPGLSGQIACASLVFMIATAEMLLLEEVGRQYIRVVFLQRLTQCIDSTAEP